MRWVLGGEKFPPLKGGADPSFRGLFPKSLLCVRARVGSCKKGTASKKGPLPFSDSKTVILADTVWNSFFFFSFFNYCMICGVMGLKETSLLVFLYTLSSLFAEETAKAIELCCLLRLYLVMSFTSIPPPLFHHGFDEFLSFKTYGLFSWEPLCCLGQGGQVGNSETNKRWSRQAQNVASGVTFVGLTNREIYDADICFLECSLTLLSSINRPLYRAEMIPPAVLQVV